MNWIILIEFVNSAKSELSQPNGAAENTHIHPHSHSEQSSIAEKLSYTFVQGKKNHIFTLVALETCGAFPVSMEMTSKNFGARERPK